MMTIFPHYPAVCDSQRELLLPPFFAWPGLCSNKSQITLSLLNLKRNVHCLTNMELRGHQVGSDFGLRGLFRGRYGVTQFFLLIQWKICISLQILYFFINFNYFRLFIHRSAYVLFLRK
jgi:hypothetical protein